jgi:hypothetical protein
MSSITPPADWKGRFVPTLDVLLFVREQVLSGIMPEMFFGRLDVRALCAFVEGIHFHLYCCGVRDEGYMEFIAWLREVKNEIPTPLGWEGKYLSDFAGDHRAAIMKFLDRCAEFVALLRRAAPRE